MLHRTIFEHDRTDDTVEFLVPANFDKKLQQFSPNTEFVPLIANEKCELGLVCTVNLAQPSHAKYFMSFPVRFLVINNQGDFTVVIIETNPGQPFVGDTLWQLERSKVAIINALFRQCFMEFYHQRFIFGPNWTQGHGCSIGQSPSFDVLSGIRTNCRPGQLSFSNFLAMQNNTCIESNEPFRRG